MIPEYQFGIKALPVASSAPWFDPVQIAKVVDIGTVCKQEPTHFKLAGSVLSRVSISVIDNQGSKERVCDYSQKAKVLRIDHGLEVRLSPLTKEPETPSSGPA
jgi:hypothetical protein